jgi:hypothetical protein
MPISQVNRWRAHLQGERFWQAQLAAADNTIEAPTELRMTWIRAEQETAPLMAELRKRKDSVLQGIPEHLRTLSVPDSLRQLADQIELENGTRNILKFMDEWSAKMRICRPEIAKRAGIRG